MKNSNKRAGATTHAERSAKAREARLRYLAEQKEAAKRIAADNKKAQAFVKIFERIGEKPATFDLKQWAETGNWHIGYRVEHFLMGVLAGVTFARGKRRAALASLVGLYREAFPKA